MACPVVSTRVHPEIDRSRVILCHPRVIGSGIPTFRQPSQSRGHTVRPPRGFGVGDLSVSRPGSGVLLTKALVEVELCERATTPPYGSVDPSVMFEELLHFWRERLKGAVGEPSRLGQECAHGFNQVLLEPSADAFLRISDALSMWVATLWTGQDGCANSGR